MSEQQAKYNKKRTKKSPPEGKGVKSPFELMELAIKSGANEQQLSQVIAYTKHHEAEEAKKEFTVALATFQNTVSEIVKNRKKQDYSFASLDDIDKVIKQCLFDNGFSKRWEMGQNGKDVTVSCIISHIGGHKEVTTMSAPADMTDQKNDVQARGSTVSYLERYTLAAALGLTIADQDNDASGPAPAEAKPKKDSLTEKMEEQIKKCTLAELKVLWESNQLLQNKQWFKTAVANKKTELFSAGPLPEEALNEIALAAGDEQLTAIYNSYPDLKRVPKFIQALSTRRTQLGITTTPPILP